MFLSKNTHKTHKIVKVTVINDNKKIRKIPRPKTMTSDFHTMTSKKMVRSYYCLTTCIGKYLHHINDGIKWQQNFTRGQLFLSASGFFDALMPLRLLITNWELEMLLTTGFT